MLRLYAKNIDSTIAKIIMQFLTLKFSVQRFFTDTEFSTWHEKSIFSLLSFGDAVHCCTVPGTETIIFDI